jgi:hypothetical protein
MRALKFFLPGLAAIALAGCASYHLGAVNGTQAGERSIEIQPFNNQTFQPRLGDVLTQSVRERIQTDATFHLATHSLADVVVTGAIHQYNRQGLGFLNRDSATPENYRVNMLVHVTARDRHSGKLILDKDIKGHTFVNIGADLASAERQAMPLLAEDVAQTIVEMLAEGAW